MTTCECRATWNVGVPRNTTVIRGVLLFVGFDDLDINESNFLLRGSIHCRHVNRAAHLRGVHAFDHVTRSCYVASLRGNTYHDRVMWQNIIGPRSTRHVFFFRFGLLSY